MTAFLQCDGCGAVVSQRPGDSDPARAWLELTEGPTPGGGLLPLVSLSHALEVDGDEVRVHEPERTLPAPALHFCGVDCLTTWAAHR